jgi:hypothetical protein
MSLSPVEVRYAIETTRARIPRRTRHREVRRNKMAASVGGLFLLAPRGIGPSDSAPQKKPGGENRRNCLPKADETIFLVRRSRQETNPCSIRLLNREEAMGEVPPPELPASSLWRAFHVGERGPTSAAAGSAAKRGAIAVLCQIARTMKPA